MPKSRRVRELDAFTKIFTRVYRSEHLAEHLVRQMRQRGRLRETLRDAKLLKRGEQAHHVIPIEALKQSRLVQKAVLEGFDINGVMNGIPMSIKRHKKHHAELAGYNRYVMQELFRLEDKYPDCSRQAALRHVVGLVQLMEGSF